MRKKPLEVRVNEQRRLEVAKNHNFNMRCKCCDCLSMWLGVESGNIVVKSFDGTKTMFFPKA